MLFKVSTVKLNRQFLHVWESDNKIQGIRHFLNFPRSIQEEEKSWLKQNNMLKEKNTVFTFLVLLILKWRKIAWSISKNLFENELDEKFMQGKYTQYSVCERLH